MKLPSRMSESIGEGCLHLLSLKQRDLVTYTVAAVCDRRSSDRVSGVAAVIDRRYSSQQHYGFRLAMAKLGLKYPLDDTGKPLGETYEFVVPETKWRV